MKNFWKSGFKVKSRLSNAYVKIVISVVVTIFTLAPLIPAMAQSSSTGTAATEKDGDAEFMLEEVAVTGSRIRGGETVGATVVGLDREKINLSAGLTVDRIIRELPQVINLGVSDSSRGQSGGSGNVIHANSINIHGIGPYATLILLDGHRVANNTRSIDPSIVPSLGLERIEVVADGASAVYGSDAIAGVVNLIPRRTLDGVETSLRFGMGDNYNEHNVGVAVGKEWSSGQVMFALEHVLRSNVNGDDRSFYTADLTSNGGPDYRTPRSAPGTINVGGTTYAIPEGGVTQATAGQLVAGTANLMDPVSGADLLPEQEYISMNATYTQTITSHIEFFADGFYTKREFDRLSNYESLDLTVPSTNAFFVQPPGTTAGSYKINYNFRDDRRESSTGSAENWEITPGFRFELPHDFQLEALYTYGETEDQSNVTGRIDSRTALSAALASSDPATAFDPYGSGRTSAATLDAIFDQVFFAPTLNTSKLYEVRLNGPLFDLPGGTVRMAAGYEGQEIDMDLGGRRGGPETPWDPWRNFTRRVDSTYVEFLVPLVGSANAMSGVRRLEFTAALRYDKYDDIDQSTTNPKIGVNYSPIEPLSFHGSWGTSFRAPQITEIYGNSDWLFRQDYQNPAGGPPLEGFAWSGPNLDLEPETATTWSIGGDFTPTQNTKFNLTFFSVEYENQIEKYLSNRAMLTIEDEFVGTGVILHGAEAGAKCVELAAQGVRPRPAFPDNDPSLITLYIDGRNRNLGVSITEGLDFQVSHLLDTASSGSFLFNLTGTYLTKYVLARTPAGEKIDKLNEIFNPLRLKARGSVSWNYRAFMTQLAFSYVNGYDNSSVTPTESIDSFIPVDIIVRLNGDNVDWLGGFGKGLSVGIEARNAFDADPPYVNIIQSPNGGGGFDPTAADPIGRVIALTLRKSF